LAEILRKARASNELHGLTGMLLHSEADVSFFQVLEGDLAAIDQPLQKLLTDNRHSHLTLIIREPIPSGLLRDGPWVSLAFRQKTRERSLGSMTSSERASSFTELDAGRAKKFLSAFVESRWRPKHLGATRIVTRASSRRAHPIQTSSWPFSPSSIRKRVRSSPTRR
jgi:Sensors of blue-light using FAD